MNSLTYDEAILFAKAVAYILGNRTISFDDADKELAVSRIKKIVDQRNDWNEQQRDQYKALVDICAEMEKR